MEEERRLFFGLDVKAPWPKRLPKGRLLDKQHRHLTLAFLGNVSYDPLRDALGRFPKVSLELGPAGYFDACLPLPERHPHVIAWHASWFHDEYAIATFQRTLVEWLAQCGYPLDKRTWLPHVTLCRQPFEGQAWGNAFVPLPFFCGGIHLYESRGDLCYTPLWSYPLLAPFEEISHTADLAFLVRGSNFEQLYHHAFTALAFKMPICLEFFQPRPPLRSLDDVIIALNALICSVDSKEGSSIKAVSFHGGLMQMSEKLLQWKMIVDV